MSPSRHPNFQEPLAILAHELRNPIGAIRNAVKLMDSVGSLPRAADEARRVIARQAAQISALVDDLTNLASVSRGMLVLRRQWTDLAQEVEAAIESCAWVIAASGHALHVEM